MTTKLTLAPSALLAILVFCFIFTGTVTAHEGHGSVLDLYIRERYENADGELCGSCEETDGCFLHSRAFYVQDVCRSRFAGRTAVYGRFDDLVCRQDFRDDGTTCDTPGTFPVFSVTFPELECGQTWPANVCEGSLEMTVLQEWCIQSPLPNGPFRTPLVTRQSYGDLDSCGGGDYASELIPVDETLCLLASVDDMVDNETMTVYGSQKYYCEENVLRSETFVDRECSVATSVVPFVDGASDICPSEASGRVDLVDCAAPTIYCKDLYATDFGMDLTTNNPTAMSSSSPTEVPSEAPTAKEPLDLYVRERYSTASGERCDVCADGDGCFLESRAFYVEDECRSRDQGRTAVYSGLETEPDIVCRQDFENDGTTCSIPDQLPIFNATASEDCSQTWIRDVCENGIEMIVLDDWCIRSDLPIEPYVTPLVRRQEYIDVDSCGGEDYSSALFPSDEALCILTTVEDEAADGETVPVYGSQRYYCEGSVVRSETFLDQECSSMSATTPTLDGASDVCPMEGSGRANLVDCTAPSLYCKDLYSTRFAFELSKDTSDPTASPSASTTGSPTPSPMDSAATPQPTDESGNVVRGGRFGVLDLLFMSAMLVLVWN